MSHDAVYPQQRLDVPQELFSGEARRDAVAGGKRVDQHLRKEERGSGISSSIGGGGRGRWVSVGGHGV